MTGANASIRTNIVESKKLRSLGSLCCHRPKHKLEIKKARPGDNEVIKWTASCIALAETRAAAGGQVDLIIGSPGLKTAGMNSSRWCESTSQGAVIKRVAGKSIN